MNLILLLAPAIAAALISYALAPLAEILAVRIGAVDQPGPRKIHHAPVARAGGLAVISASVVVVGAMYGLRPHARPTWLTDLWLGVGFGLLPIIVVSVRDDIRSLRAGPKLIAHVLGAAIAVWFGISLAGEVHLFGQTISIGLLAVPLSMLWIVGVTNAFNIVDGLDGLSAGLGFISSLSLGGVFILVGQTGMATAVLVLTGALGGFLPYNVYPARMFLGDTGATAVGFCLAALALKGGSTLSAGFAVLLPVFVLGLPIAETLISMARRTLKRLEQNGTGGVFEPDKNHLHHRLLALGIDHRRAVFILYGAGLLLASGALVSMLMTTLQAALFALALLLAGFIGVARLGYDEFAVIQNGVVLRLYEAPVLKKSMFVVLVDLLIVVAAVYCAVGLKTDDWRLVTSRATAFSMMAVLAPTSVAVFWYLGIYRGSWRLADARDFARACCAVVLAALIGATTVMLLFQDAGASSVSLFSIYALVALVFVTGSRASYQILSAMHRATRHGTEAVIYGAGRRGARAFRELTADLDADLSPVAFIDDDPDKTGKLVSGVPVVGSVRTLETTLRRYGARAVIVSSDKIPLGRLTEVRDLCERRDVAFLKMHINLEHFATIGALQAEPSMAKAAGPAARRSAAVPQMSWTSSAPGPVAHAVWALDKPPVAGPARVRFEPVSDSGGPKRHVVSQPCNACGAFTLHRSHARSLSERVRKKLSQKRVFRCGACGWRGWSEIMDFAVRQPPAALSHPAPLLESIDAILQRSSSSR